MKIHLNGESHEVAEGTTLAELVSDLGLKRFAFAVELNREVVPREAHEETVLASSDRIEVVTFVGGG